MNKLSFIKHLRKNTTQAEGILWGHLRNRRLKGYKFRRQAQIKTFIVDFVCYERDLIIELDGGHHNFDAHEVYDIQRTQHLNKEGFKVLRFWNHEVLFNLLGVVGVILRELDGND